MALLLSRLGSAKSQQGMKSVRTATSGAALVPIPAFARHPRLAGRITGTGRGTRLSMVANPVS
jgi:hypothetical protein